MVQCFIGWAIKPTIRKVESIMSKDLPKFTSLIIGVKDPKVNLSKFTKPGCDRFKRWGILLKCDGKTVSEYYAECRKAGFAVSANNPRDAATKFEFITLTPPK